MRVLMLVSEAPPIKSGIARVAGELTERLRARGVEIDTMSANEIPRWAFKEFRFSSLALQWPRIQRMLSDYDILHVHGSVPTFSDFGLLLGRLGLAMSRPGAAIVYTHHSDIDIKGLDGPVSLYNGAHSRLLRLADHVVASTPTYAERLEKHSKPGRVSAVGFGVDFERFPDDTQKPERLHVLFVGQLRPYKGVDVLLRAWQQVENADLHIVGDGHERAALEDLAARLHLKSVHFHGSVSESELDKFYSSAHTLVLPSNRKAEAFGLVLLEGMAAGCVPVSSDLPGVSDVVGDNGFTFPVGDSDALARILLDLRDNPEKRNLMGVFARSHAIATTWDQTAEAYCGIYLQAYLGRKLERMSERGLTSALLQKWLRKVTRAADADRASLMLVPPGTRKLRIVASTGISAQIAANTELPIGQRMAGYVAHTGRSLLVRRRGMTGVARFFVKKDSNLTSSLVLPIRHGGKTIGVLNLARGQNRLQFSQDDCIWLGKLAIQVAPIMSRYRLKTRFSNLHSGTAPSVQRVPLDVPAPLLLTLRAATGQESMPRVEKTVATPVASPVLSEASRIASVIAVPTRNGEASGSDAAFPTVVLPARDSSHYAAGS